MSKHPPLKVIKLLTYSKKSDDLPGEYWEEAQAQRRLAVGAFLRMSYRVELVTFEPESYREWLGGRKDTRQERSNWAAYQMGVPAKPDEWL